jgi:hypothetical protein
LARNWERKMGAHLFFVSVEYWTQHFQHVHINWECISIFYYEFYRKRVKFGILFWHQFLDSSFAWFPFCLERIGRNWKKLFYIHRRLPGLVWGVSLGSFFISVYFLNTLPLRYSGFPRNRNKVI